MGEDWRSQPYANEYDRYLCEAVQQLHRGCSAEEVVDYLFFIQSDYMGLGPAHMDARLAAKLHQLVQALRMTLKT